MSDEAKPKKHRRRQRSRKKKAAATIDSMIPGRAPMGVQSLLHHVESKKPTLPGAWPEEGSEEQNMPSSSTPPQLQSPISMPSKRDPSTRSPISTLSNIAEPDTFDSSPLSQSSLPARVLSSSIRSVTHTGLFQGSRTISDHHFSSPLPIKARRSLSTMTTQRLSLMSPSTPTRTSRFAAQGESYESDSLEHLASSSSQPVPLNQLCARASSRLPTGQTSKGSHIENLDDDDKEDMWSVTGLRDTGETKSLSRLSTIHRANSKECRLNRYKEDVLIPSRFYSETQGEAFEPPKEQDSETWYNGGDIRPHRNPLSYSCGYDSAFAYSASGPYDAISGSPFTNNTNHHNEYVTWPAVRSYQKLFTEASPGNSRLNNILAESSLSIYRESFDRPENQSPYESLRTQRSSHKHPDIRDVAANMSTWSTEPHLERRMTYLSSHYDAFREQASELDIRCAVDQPSTPGSSLAPPTSDPKHPLGKGSARLSEQSDSPSAEEIRKRSIKDEVTAFLRAIVQNSYPKASQMDLQSLSQETKPPLSEHSSPESNTKEMASRGQYSGTDNEVKRSPSAASWDSPENKDHKPASVLKEACVSSQHGYLYEEIMEKVAKKADKSKLNKAVRPPPGIPDPVVQNPPMGPSYHGRTPFQVQERLDDANSWFSTDNRGEQQLRQQVTDIAENYAQRIDRSNGNGAFPDSATAKQMTLLLGNVVINLHSYGSPDSHSPTKQGGYFANFGRAKSRYCEPSLGGRCSYFDQDPSTNQWKFSPERKRMLSDFKDGLEDYPDSKGSSQEGERA